MTARPDVCTNEYCRLDHGSDGRHQGEPAPGDPIVTCSCPCCGAALEITHGDDDGEIAVIGTPAPKRRCDQCGPDRLMRREADMTALDPRLREVAPVGTRETTVLIGGKLLAVDWPVYPGTAQGEALRRGRADGRLTTIREAADRVGLRPSEWSGLEVGRLVPVDGDWSWLFESQVEGQEID